MKKIKAMIVDDSKFSIRVATSLLEKCGVEVVDVAMSVAEAIEKHGNNIGNIDLITMDITLPDGDGIDCAMEITKKDLKVDIMIVSSMLDDEIIKRAKDAGARTCIQKPIEEDDFVSKVTRLFEGDKLFEEIKESYESVFIEATVGNLTRATKSRVDYQICDLKDTVVNSKGMSVTLGLIGAHRGRVIFDVSRETAKEITKKVYGIDDITMEEVSEYMVELTNIICGNAVSLLNGINRSFGLRVSPPTTFYGDDLEVVVGDIKGSIIKFDTIFGEVFLNVGFQRGKTEWM